MLYGATFFLFFFEGDDVGITQEFLFHDVSYSRNVAVDFSLTLITEANSVQIFHF
ncbi:hypothetical protein BCV72DRAFT_226881 [Rhizopus microsporus var. microsporus]|uniref:Uncharacterized protein n=2 Tax=Rhizopus microsporus TaxID=58291 RepID=A0A2G4SX62_RHIZD|nr:uncharacterized protein RHIMIDRAFT_279052 [Rhizopus microsporus ATCC 52813]ORE07298.1 hypothetical protein BCV72DRAFT_226881 [Rhizopus microsporus var. microsporus]PHZ13334.1 hypothetical protein RHIMIDRAFT_279052 [Rhizopus microsporus ATCC 52813]